LGESVIFSGFQVLLPTCDINMEEHKMETLQQNGRSLRATASRILRAETANSDEKNLQKGRRCIASPHLGLGVKSFQQNESSKGIQFPNFA
jgi:hypothetical protein